MDDLIPKITDFAQRIDAHILGIAPPAFSQAAAPVAPTPAAHGTVLPGIPDHFRNESRPEGDLYRYDQS